MAINGTILINQAMTRGENSSYHDHHSTMTCCKHDDGYEIEIVVNLCVIFQLISMCTSCYIVKEVEWMDENKRKRKSSFMVDDHDRVNSILVIYLEFFSLPYCNVIGYEMSCAVLLNRNLLTFHWIGN